MSIKEKVLELYSQGKTYSQMHEILGISKGTISYHLQRAGFGKSGITPEEYSLKEVLRLKKYRQDIKLKAVALKGGKCEVCGYSKCLRALEFHHIDPTQKETAISNTFNWEKVLIELSKCILVCRNCHAEIHDEMSKKQETII